MSIISMNFDDKSEKIKNNNCIYKVCLKLWFVFFQDSWPELSNASSQKEHQSYRWMVMVWVESWGKTAKNTQRSHRMKLHYRKGRQQEPGRESPLRNLGSYGKGRGAVFLCSPQPWVTADCWIVGELSALMSPGNTVSVNLGTSSRQSSGQPDQAVHLHAPQSQTEAAGATLFVHPRWVTTLTRELQFSCCHITRSPTYIPQNHLWFGQSQWIGRSLGNCEVLGELQDSWRSSPQCGPLLEEGRAQPVKVSLGQRKPGNGGDFGRDECCLTTATGSTVVSMNVKRKSLPALPIHCYGPNWGFSCTSSLKTC